MKERMKDIYLYFCSQKIQNPKTPKNVKSLLFICKGNICRSAFAERAARKIAAKRSMTDVIVSSAGLEVSTPVASPVEAIAAAKAFGIDLLDHRSNGVTYSSAESFDMIIGMESWHIHRLREICPDSHGKIYLLPMFENNRKRRIFSYHQWNIADPYGEPIYKYRECFQRIERCIEVLLSGIGTSDGEE